LGDFTSNINKVKVGEKVAIEDLTGDLTHHGKR